MDPDVLARSASVAGQLVGTPNAAVSSASARPRRPLILPDETRQAIRRLAAYRPPPPPDDVIYPLSRSAAVLVALFVGRTGELYVMLNRRAETLRTFPGDTSLPGGRWEPGDRTLEDTARREAFEEMGLPQDRQRLPLLCYLHPFVTGSNLLVTPVVVLVLDPFIRPVLNEPEVSAIFSHPFKSFLSRESPFKDGLHHEPHTPDPKGPLPGLPKSLKNPPTLVAVLRARPARSRVLKPDSLARDGGIPVSSRERGDRRHEKSVIPDLPPSSSSTSSSDTSKSSDDAIIDPQSSRINTPSSSPQTRAQNAATLGWKKYRASTELGDEEEAGEVEYYSYRDLKKWGQGPVRMHRFLTGREDSGIKPVYGLTATILLHAAMIAYDREPDFAQRAPGERTVTERVHYALETVPVFRQAVEEERKRREELKRLRRKGRERESRL